MKREEVDSSTVERLMRDICYLYHQFADYKAVMPDVDFGGIYELPYWDFLDTSSYVVFESIPPEDALFIREGCLVMIFTMACECLEDAGYYILQHLTECKTHVGRMIPEDVRDDKLIDIVKRALEMVETSQYAPDELQQMSLWVYGTCVHRYFAERSAPLSSLEN